MKQLVLLSLALLLLASCASMATGPSASATLSPTSGSTASGTVTFTTRSDGKVDVVVHITGVPEGVHGFHIHDKGDCGDNGNAAGGHFNPTSAPHAAPSAASHHAGDFGNVTADPQGVVHATYVADWITVATGPNSVIGRGVILHANPDDLTTQPTGNAGARIACGVVEAK